MALSHKWIMRLPPNHTAALHTAPFTPHPSSVRVKLQWQENYPDSIKQSARVRTSNPKTFLRPLFLHLIKGHKFKTDRLAHGQKIKNADIHGRHVLKKKKHERQDSQSRCLFDGVLSFTATRNDVSAYHSCWLFAHFLRAFEPLASSFLSFCFPLPLGWSVSFIQ